MQRLAMLLMCAAFTLCACKKRPFEAIGSCISYANSTCLDLAVVNDDVRKICSGGAFTLNATPCDRANTLGGCRKGNMLTWYFPSSEVKTAADVKTKCASDTFVMPDGKEPAGS
jgi:hypothetical protein